MSVVKKKKRKVSGVLKHGSVVQSNEFISRGPEMNSQHVHGSLQTFVTPQATLSICVVQNYKCKIPMNIKIKKMVTQRSS